MSKRKKGNDISPGEAIRETLGLSALEWRIGIGYSKGFLSGSRGANITVTHLATGKSKSMCVCSAGKAAVRRDSVAIVRQLVKELQ